MKGLLAVTLLLMSTLPCVAPSNDYEQFFSVDNLDVDVPVLNADAQGKFFTHVSKDAARNVVVELEKIEQYLMRIDPVEKCGRVVICQVESNPKACDKTKDAIVLNPMGDKKIYKNTPPGLIEIITEKMEDDNILVKFSQTGAGTATVTFTFNYRTDNKAEHGLAVLDAKTTKIRVETSSFYCKVNIGVVAGAAAKYFPTMTVPKTDDYGITGKKFDLKPFRTRKSASTGRTYFGPLFRRASNQHVFQHSPTEEGGACEKEDLKCVGFKEYVLDKSALCPHAHDWMGFSRWTEPIEKTDQKKYNTTFFKHPIYRYGLQMDTAAGTCGVESSPYQIEIELNQVFDIGIQRNFHRCFGFALVFETEANDVDTTGLTLDPALTFEFYLPAMMFIAPDTEKVRALRINRSDLKKIRLSFYEEGTSPNAKEYAIVEYGFLNDNIPGVREHISLKSGSIKNFQSVTLFSEGYCEVRVLNANQDKKESENLCMHLSGCDVLKLSSSKAQQ